MFQWSWLLAEIDSLTMDFGSPFIQVGNLELPVLGACVLLCICMKLALDGQGHVGSLIKFCGLYLMAYTMLYYFDQPAWFLNGNDFKHAIPDAATYLADVIEQSRYDQGMKRIGFLLDHLERPTIDFWHGRIDIFGIMAYTIVEVFMVILGSVLMIPIGTSFIALGIGTLVWPVFIPWLIVPGVSWLFWNPLSFIIKYSFYRVFAVALTFILAGVCERLIDYALVLDTHQDIAGISTPAYSLAQFTGLTLIGVVFLVSMSIYMIIELTNLVRDFFGGGSGAGSNFLGSVSRIVS